MALSVNQLIQLIETPKEQAASALGRFGGIEGVADSLQVSLEYGLDSSNETDLATRQETFGRNYVEPEKPLTIFQLMWHAFQDLTIIILTCAGVLSLILGFIPFDKLSSKKEITRRELAGGDPATAWIEGASILFAVFIVVFVTAINDYQKEKQFRALNSIKDDESIKVIRDGVPAEVSKFDLLVGDIVRIDVGDIIPADGLVFDESELKLDESTMTGESDLLKKNRKTAPFLLSGTKVMEGVGKMLVICVGENSQAGIISKLIMGKEKPKPVAEGYTSLETPRASSDLPTRQLRVPDEPEEEVVSPLQGKLDRLTLLIGKLGLFTSIFVVVALIVRFSIVKFGIDNESWDNEYLKDYLNHFILGVTVLVVAIPEGLPLAVTIALAFSVKKMLKDNNLVRHLDACETMGSATTICSDKTGTLTTNRMTVMECYIGGEEFRVASSLRLQASAITKEILCASICINSTAEILPPKQFGGQPEHTGNKTECALLQYAADLGVEYAGIRKAATIAHMLTFSSAKKRMSVIVPLGDTSCRIFTKGASEIVLALCTTQLALDGSRFDLSPSAQAAINSTIIEKYANQAYRTLCIAYRDVNVSSDEVKTWSDEKIEQDLTMICIVGIEDPVREEVPESIRQCNKAGIVVRMVTGDNLATAKSIAYKCGIVTPNDGSIIMEGRDFRERVLDANGNINQVEFDKIWPMLRVLARSSPKDKYTLVSGLIQSNVFPHGPQVVAVTGDGTNDAPALKKADVGFAMGICGTAVAKDASDIILMDDNFKSIVNAVKWGRNVYDSIAKFLQFQLTVNIVAITTAVVGAVILEESPLSAIQLLWVNLIMDTFASLALATDTPTEAMLERKPYPRTRALISPLMAKHMFGQAIFQLVVILVMTFKGDILFGIPSGRKYDPGATRPSVHYTMIFNTFVFLQLFNEINARRIHDEWNVFEGIFSNHLFIGISVIQVVLQVFIVEYGSIVFGCVALDGSQWLICILIGALSLPVGFLLRCLPLPKFFTSCTQDSTIVKPSNPRTIELWQSGFKRIRVQLRVIKAFKQSIDAPKAALKL